MTLREAWGRVPPQRNLQRALSMIGTVVLERAGMAPSTLPVSASLHARHGCPGPSTSPWPSSHTSSAPEVLQAHKFSSCPHELLIRMDKLQSHPQFPAEPLELILFVDSNFHELIGQKYWQSHRKHVFFLLVYDVLVTLQGISLPSDLFFHKRQR